MSESYGQATLSMNDINNNQGTIQNIRFGTMVVRYVQ